MHVVSENRRILGRIIHNIEVGSDVRSTAKASSRIFR
ncbi:hypothetical protein D906_00003 [Pseudomonas sp. LAIL14HWK12:I1]|nr:hypothetical protein D906_00003 [Pseudomonas sp. LAIL14HWK12:I1]SOC95066.1 hypothetical protein SAMN05660198_00003 [Pseudomonas sp. LAIL14HWK12:I3]